MLPNFDLFDATGSSLIDVFSTSCEANAQVVAASNHDAVELLPSLASLQALVSRVSRQNRERQARHEQSQPNKNTEKAEYWGNINHSRRFHTDSDGSVCYEFRSGDTITAVVTDLLLELKKVDARVAVNYQSVRQTALILMAHNQIKDADLITSGAKLNIPIALTPAYGNKAA